MGDRVAAVNRQVRISDVEAFVDPEIVAARLQGVNESSLTEKEQEALRAFRRAMERHRTGKGDAGSISDRFLVSNGNGWVFGEAQQVPNIGKRARKELMRVAQI
jgi:type II secretory pathway pseudopilin PulG